MCESSQDIVGYQHVAADRYRSMIRISQIAQLKVSKLSGIEGTSRVSLLLISNMKISDLNHVIFRGCSRGLAPIIASATGAPNIRGSPRANALIPGPAGRSWILPTVWLIQRKKVFGFANEADVCLIHKLFDCRFDAYRYRPATLLSLGSWNRQ